MSIVDEPEPVGYLVHIDPRTLLAHRRNLRTDLGDLTELTASIASEGVLQAITVLPEGDGGYRVVAGHRRTAAAAEALESGAWKTGTPETIPCVVRPDLVGRPVEQILMMLGENDHRNGLTPSEEASGYAQLVAFEMPPAEIARRASKPLPHVMTSLKLDALPPAAKRAADAGSLTLEDVKALEEFADDPTVVQRCIDAAGNSWGVKHEISEARRRRDVAASYRKVHAQLLADDVAIVRKPKGWDLGECAPAEVSKLRDQSGNELDLEAVKRLVGFAAFIETDHYGARAVYICLDPESKGLKRVGYSRYQTPQARAAAEAQTRAKESFLAALVDSGVTRRQFLVETWGSLAGAQSVFTEALRMAVTRPSLMVRSAADLVSALAGADVEDGVTGSHERLVRLLVARWAAAEEENVMAVARGAHSYSAVPERVVGWFARLIETGYRLSAAEQGLLERVRTRLEEEAAEEVDEDAVDGSEADFAEERDAEEADGDGGSGDVEVDDPEQGAVDIPGVESPFGEGHADDSSTPDGGVSTPAHADAGNSSAADGGDR